MIQNIITPEIVAKIVQCSPGTVRRIISGKRNRHTQLGQKICLAKILLEQGSDKLLNDVKVAVTNTNQLTSN